MNRQHRYKLIGLCIGLGLFGASLPVNAQTVTPFQILGHIQNFCLDNQFNTATGSCPKDAEARTVIPPFSPADLPNTLFLGAKMVVNGVTITIPRNTVVVMPATYLTPWQIFNKAQGISRGHNESGLALQDQTPPLAAFEASVDGNIVCTAAATCTYIAGQVHISQQSLNLGAGFIRQIRITALPTDPANGFICIGASSTALPTAAPCVAPDARIRLNEPALEAPDVFAGDGRYGAPSINAALSTSTDLNSRFPDPRFTVDQGNPTVHALTGYPMCVPRSADDLECPSTNRPAGLTTFVMDTVPLIPPVNFGSPPIPICPPIPIAGCDPDKQVPFIVGDYITYAGTLAQDATGPFVSVHTMVGNVGIYTKPGGRAYVTLDESLVGTNGPILVCGSVAECQNRLKVEGFSTDPSRKVNVYAVDVAFPSGTQTARLLHGTEKVQAVFGRFRYVPPLTVAGLHDLDGVLTGVTRELMIRIDDGTPFPDGSSIPSTPVAAHGLVAGIYVAPVGEYIFPEPKGVQGGPQPALNFQCLAFLVNGWSLPGLPSIPRLAPWPGSTPPTFSCTN